jgi:hypothetical protein
VVTLNTEYQVCDLWQVGMWGKWDWWVAAKLP